MLLASIRFIVSSLHQLIYLLNILTYVPLLPHCIFLFDGYFALIILFIIDIPSA